MYRYVSNLSQEKHDQFVANSDMPNILQSANWAKIKDNWKNFRLGFFKNDELVAVASLLIQPLPLGFSLIYIPRGPIMNYLDKELVAFVLKSLKEFAKSNRAIFIKFDPSLFLTRSLVNDTPSDKKETLTALTILQNLGCDWSGRTTDINDNIQPRFQANIYAEYFTDDHLSKSTKQAIRTVRNKGLDVSFGQEEFLDDFSELMKKTEHRKAISLRNRDYYKKLLKTYKDHSYITMTHLDLNKRQRMLLEQQEKLLLESQTLTNKKGKLKNNQNNLERIADELEFLEKKISEGKTVVPLAATLTLEFAGTSENIYAGMDEDYRRYQPAIFTWYHTAKHAFERGAIWQNMGGVENDLNGGLFGFKSKFNPIIEEYLGEFNLPVNPILYHLTNFAYRLRKKLRSKTK